jgi:hypothetical protein
MTTITWKISQLDCLPQEDGDTDVVFIVHWSCNGVDGDYNGSVYSTCSVPFQKDKSFTPYADLTLDQVLGWVWANGVDKDATEAAVQQQIDNQINPPVVSPPLPWVSP